MQAATEDSNSTDAGSSASATYEVEAGDNLWNISGKSEIYSDSYQWPLIYKANRDKIKDADLIYSGQTLDIDRSASQADMDAAINHAKTRGAWTLGEQEASDKAYLGE
ncbi:MAG: LysM peptidoglycan-binding domain-containing protein [Gammaproteobacteria bacterium]|nr:LysM peptidoglycan-binding domain-containing protein [Gammaproteobacteria bacterium]